MVSFALSGCYQSHVRLDLDGAVLDARARDAEIDDAPRVDAPEVDGGPIVCNALRATQTVSLDEGVTPRIVALPGGHIGVVYVRTERDGVGVIYERLDATLTRLTGPVRVASDGFSWAEIVVQGGELLIAYGLAGSAQTVLLHLSFDGVQTSERALVPLLHPSILESNGAELFWAAFDMRTENTFVLSHVTPTGMLTGATVTIPFGRYGSGHHALARSDGSHILGYSREGPPGARHGYVNRFSADGTLGPERQLDPMDPDQAVIPLALAGELVIVRETDALEIERTNGETLERIDHASFPPLVTSPIAGVIADRLVVAHLDSGVFRWDLFDAALAHFERDEVRTMHPGIGSGTSVAEHPDALTFAAGLTNGSTASPWLVRLECAR